MTIQEARKALKMAILQAHKQRTNFLSLIASMQISEPSQNVQSMDNITHEKTSEDITNFNLAHPRPDTIPCPGYSRDDISGIISGFLEE
jgi:hypothetical protein